MMRNLGLRDWIPPRGGVCSILKIAGFQRVPGGVASLLRTSRVGLPRGCNAVPYTHIWIGGCSCV